MNEAQLRNNLLELAKTLAAIDDVLKTLRGDTSDEETERLALRDRTIKETIRLTVPEEKWPALLSYYMDPA